VITAHSLEPLRPWKKEQLGGGYAVSSSIEKSAYESADAVIAVSEGMRQDIYRAYPDLDKSRVHVIHNGIDISTWQPREDNSVLSRFNINPDARSVVFVGRITRQKGLPYLLEAVADLPDDVQIILCAGAADTPEILAEVTHKVEQLQAHRSGVIWISEHLSPTDLSVILSHATTFVCPSIYEPLGIVNLEAMACGIPVVGTATGGIPEVIDDGVTGWLVPIEQHMDGTGTPLDPQKFVSDLSRALNVAVADVSLAKKMGVAARDRAATHFNWDVIAEQTRGIYERVLTN
jgi:starch synthase